MLLPVNSSQNNINFTSAFELDTKLSAEQRKEFKNKFITKEKDCPYRYITSPGKKGIGKKDIKTIISIDNGKDQEIKDFLDKINVGYKKTATALKFLEKFYKDNIKLSKKKREHINGIKLKVVEDYPKCGLSKAEKWAILVIDSIKITKY